jgi:peptidoglycan/LPS O-acetylase OafA/YrhL
MAVLLFHAEFSFASGGFLGVSLFFTLSGFLITTLLLDEHDVTGTLSFRRFYGRRVRRLLPAAYACLLLVAALSGLWAAGQLRALPGDLLAAVANVANWRFAFSSTSYQDLFLGEPSPVAHFWSLAIEEQIYLVLPVVIFTALRRGRGTLAATTGALLVASVAATLLTSDRDLVYNGTHTRAAELLVGVALAQLLHRPRTTVARPAGSPLPPPTIEAVSGRSNRSTWLPGSLALGGFLLLFTASSLQQSWIYRGGLVGVALVSAVLIAAVVHGRFPASLLAAAPLVAIGRVSYGIYLFHWPVFLVLDEQRTGLDRPSLFVVRCAVTAALTFGSYALIEQPVRRGRAIGRDRAMVPAMLVAAAVVIVAAVAVVPTPRLTDTEQLLALGDEDVVDFGAVPTAAAPAVLGATPEPSSPADSSTTAESTVPLGPPARVAVLGSEPMAVSALVDSDRDRDFDVIQDVRPDCPLSSAVTPGCERPLDRWGSIAAGGPVDVLVMVTNGAEAADSLAKRVAAVTDTELVALGAADEAAIGEILATIDAALASGADVIWYTPAHPITAFFRHFSRIGLERPQASTVVGGVARMVDAVRGVTADRLAREGDNQVDDQAVRVLVIGDSTSLNFARALHDGSDGRLAVLWAGKNGCPFAAVEASRGQSNVPWADGGCEPWSVKVPPLLESFDPDLLFVMTGPMELLEHRFPGDPEGRIATDPVFGAAREAQLDALLAVVGPDLPVLVADLPAIAEGRFSGAEMTSPDRLAAVNAQIVDWDRRFVQVSRFPYRDTLAAAEAARPADDQIRSDGTHPDVEPLAELARDVYVAELIAMASEVRSELAAAAVMDG